MADGDFGGEMRFSVNGNLLVLRMKFDHEPASIDMDGGANQDGSTYRTVKPMGSRIEPTFEDFDYTNQNPNVNVATDQNWEAIMRGGPYNVTLIEDHVRVMHTWTGLKFEGRPRIDRQTGEVTGITGRCPKGGYNVKAL